MPLLHSFILIHLFIMEFIEIGYVADVFGIKGQVKAKMDVFDIQEYRKKKTLFLRKRHETTEPVRFSVEKFEAKTHIDSVISFAGVDTREKAENLIGHTLFILQEELPKLAKHQFYYFEVIGFEVNDEKQGILGVVKEIYELPAQDVIVMLYKGKEVMIPMTHEFVLRADKENKQMITNLPAGLVEMYLE